MNIDELGLVSVMSRLTAENITAWLKDEMLCNDLELMGSYRRGEPIIKDIDLITADMDALYEARQLDGVEIMQAGAVRTIILVRFEDRKFQVDINYVHPSERGPGLLHHTGNGKFNQITRWLAKKRGWKLNQYGLWDGFGSRIDQNTEEDILSKLDILHHLDPATRGK